MPRSLNWLALAVVLFATFIPTLASADDQLDFDVNGGHFFTQTNGSSLGPQAGGYLISDESGIPFWTYFSQQGGADVLGYPVSTRFLWNGFVCQATQRAILQWNPKTQSVDLANSVDYLSTVGEDDWLYQKHLVPRAQQPSQEISSDAQPLSFLQRAHLRFAWLYQDSPIFQRYFSTPDYYSVYGLPTSPIEDLGPYFAARFQRAVIYHWKIPVPWADASGVSVGLVGDIYKELGLLPALAVKPESSKTAGHPAAPVPVPISVVLPTATPVASAPTSVPPATPIATAPTPAPTTETTTSNASNLPVLIGVATWYGSDFQGQLMYDGRPFNMYDPTTTASNAYPMGTWLRITRLSTGASILVQVTDRGGFRYPDIVDLSYAAFSKLADPATGVIRVRVEPV